MDTTTVGQTAATLMEELLQEEEAEVGTVLVMAEVIGHDDEGEWTAIRWLCSDTRGWVQRGMLHEALRQRLILVESEEDEEED